MGGDSAGGDPNKAPSQALGSTRSMGNSTGTLSRDAFSTVLERQTVSRVRAAIEAKEINPKNLPQALEWIAGKENESSAKQAAKEERWREREIAAAEVSAEAAKVSADEARRNSRIAMAAAFIAMIAAITAFFK